MLSKTEIRGAKSECFKVIFWIWEARAYVFQQGYWSQMFEPVCAQEQQTHLQMVEKLQDRICCDCWIDFWEVWHTLPNVWWPAPVPEGGRPSFPYWCSYIIIRWNSQGEVGELPVVVKVDALRAVPLTWSGRRCTDLLWDVFQGMVAGIRTTAIQGWLHCLHCQEARCVASGCNARNHVAARHWQGLSRHDPSSTPSMGLT